MKILSKFFFALAAIAVLSSSPAVAQGGFIPVAPQATPAVSTGVVLKSVGGVVYGVNVTSGATSGYVMLFDATAIPADGAVTPKFCIPLNINTGIDTNWRSAPKLFNTGIVLVFSSTGCYTKTASATAFLSADVK